MAEFHCRSLVEMPRRNGGKLLLCMRPARAWERARLAAEAANDTPVWCGDRSKHPRRGPLRWPISADEGGTPVAAPPVPGNGCSHYSHRVSEIKRLARSAAAAPVPGAVACRSRCRKAAIIAFKSKADDQQSTRAFIMTNERVARRGRTMTDSPALGKFLLVESRLR